MGRHGVPFVLPILKKDTLPKIGEYGQVFFQVYFCHFRENGAEGFVGEEFFVESGHEALDVLAGVEVGFHYCVFKRHKFMEACLILRGEKIYSIIGL